MKIEIWSDIACPYCYIGKRKLEEALEQFPHRDEVELEWNSYELYPELPQKALDIPLYKYLAQEAGMSEAEAKKSLDSTARLAKEAGLSYDYDNLVVANTSDALRLVKLAKESHLATEAEEVLFDAYFVKGKDISDRGTLLSLGEAIGLSKESVNEMLAGGRYRKDIKMDMAYSENVLRLEYIPFYVFNNKQMVQGSIAVEEYLKVLNESYREWKENRVSCETGGIITGQSCSIDGVCS